MFLIRMRRGIPKSILQSKGKIFYLKFPLPLIQFNFSFYFVSQQEFITSNNQHIRCLYSGEELGVKKYEESRKVVEHAIANHMFFKTQFRKQLMNTDYNLTHLEYGLKNLLHIMNNNDNDISILKDALKTLIHKQNEYDGDKYRFDTVVMRAFHYLNMPDQAVEVLNTFLFIHLLSATKSSCYVYSFLKTIFSVNSLPKSLAIKFSWIYCMKMKNTTMFFESITIL